MATSATARVGSLHPDDWIRAAQARLAGQGVESVRVEVLARDLGVSKGSFYWHFRDRGELLDSLLVRWEDSELDWLNRDDGASAATRWARFLERTASPKRMRMEIALRAWARGDEGVATRVAAIEKRKARLIEDVLRDIGFAETAAESWSEVALLICLGWLDLATRDKQFQFASRSLGDLLSEFILAASGGSSAPNR
ncbi:MAG: TetR/AcrR family transcriptional regulator [Candidatus Acidoferrales bacterium]|nr:TetR/AcrR family transcriptional regulator [Candidatus Acidoferrales bacterium]